MSIDDNYIEQAMVLFRSLADNHDCNIAVIIFNAGLSAKNKEMLQCILDGYGYKLQYVSVDKELFRDAPKRINISVETYFRLLAFELLPNVDKVLYLDADIVVDGSLEKLWNLDMGEYCIAGVADQGNVQEDTYHRAILGLKRRSVYINGGVLLMDLNNIRGKISVDDILKYIAEMGGRLKYQDQDVVNVLFEDEILYLPAKYNCTPLYKNTRDFTSYYCYPQKRKRPCIIHYMGGAKPWRDFYGYKYFKEYKKYCYKTKCRKLKWKMLLNSILRPIALMIQYYDNRLYG